MRFHLLMFIYTKSSALGKSIKKRQRFETGNRKNQSSCQDETGNALEQQHQRTIKVEIDEHSQEGYESMEDERGMGQNGTVTASYPGHRDSGERQEKGRKL